MKNSKKEERKNKGEGNTGRTNEEPLRVAQIIYGTKDLTDCMESAIKLYTGK